MAGNRGDRGSDRGSAKTAKGKAAGAPAQRTAGKSGKVKSDHKRASAYIPKQGGKRHK